MTTLLEAAYYRQYGEAPSGGRMEFSQADIFIQNTMLHQDRELNTSQQGWCYEDLKETGGHGIVITGFRYSSGRPLGARPLR